MITFDIIFSHKQIFFFIPTGKFSLMAKKTLQTTLRILIKELVETHKLEHGGVEITE